MIAEILARHGIAPQRGVHLSPPVPTAPNSLGPHKSAPRLTVPVVPGVPTEICSMPPPSIIAACDRLQIDPAPILRAVTGEDLTEFDSIAADHPDPAGFADAYVIAIRDRLTREAGGVPLSHTAPAFCEGCGPVLLWPEIAAQADLRAPNGWPMVVTCPWCFSRHAGRIIPRPT